ncbi:MAG: TadE family protein [Gemmatimonadaceae bacterium]
MTRSVRRARFLVEEAGTAILEFALIVPLLLVLVWGIIEAGRAFYTLNILTNALREGARRGAVMQLAVSNQGVVSMSASQRDSIKLVVRTAFQPLGPALTNAQIVDNMVVNNNQIQVTANYPYAPIAPVTNWTFTLTRSVTFRYERAP